MLCFVWLSCAEAVMTVRANQKCNICSSEHTMDDTHKSKMQFLIWHYLMSIITLHLWPWPKRKRWEGGWTKVHSPARPNPMFIWTFGGFDTCGWMRLCMHKVVTPMQASFKWDMFSNLPLVCVEEKFQCCACIGHSHLQMCVLVYFKNCLKRCVARNLGSIPRVSKMRSVLSWHASLSRTLLDL